MLKLPLAPVAQTASQPPDADDPPLAASELRGVGHELAAIIPTSSVNLFRRKNQTLLDRGMSATLDVGADYARSGLRERRRD